MEGGFASRNGNTSNLSASITPTCKFYFCSQALAVMVKTMEMCQWTGLNPIWSERERGGALFLEMEILPTYHIINPRHI